MIISQHENFCQLMQIMYKLEALFFGWYKSRDNQGVKITKVITIYKIKHMRLQKF